VVLSWVVRVDWFLVVEEVKKECNNVACGLLKELECRFFSQEIMNAIGIIYPKFWLQPKIEHIFLAFIGF
jgi:hypothetical protein